MSSEAWLFQKAEHVRDMGAENAPHYVGWYEPEGKRRSKSFGAGERGRKAAQKFKRKVESQLMCGTYRSQDRKTWEQFREDLRVKVLEGMEPATRRLTTDALNHFERIAKPYRMGFITTETIDAYVAARLKEPGKRKGETVSEATVNKELRHLRAALRFAFDWTCIVVMPRFRFRREEQHIPTYMTGEHFAAIYAACDTARLPDNLPHPVADWWRAVLVVGYMTGWRINQIITMRRDRLDLDAGTVRVRAQDTKGKRDELVKLHPVVIEHLKKVPGFDPHVLPWNHNIRTIYAEFARIQQAAKIHLPCDQEHEHTPACHVYGFHDLRRAFATMNYDKLSPDALQKLMQHRSYLTTQRYINLGREMDQAVAKLHVPEFLQRQAK